MCIVYKQQYLATIHLLRKEVEHPLPLTCGSVDYETAHERTVLFVAIQCRHIDYRVSVTCHIKRCITEHCVVKNFHTLPCPWPNDVNCPDIDLPFDTCILTYDTGDMRHAGCSGDDGVMGSLYIVIMYSHEYTHRRSHGYTHTRSESWTETDI